MGLPLGELRKRMSAMEFAQHYALERADQQAAQYQAPPEELQWVG